MFQKRKSIQFIVSIICILTFAFALYGQKKAVSPTRQRVVSQCQLTEAPTVRGFFLGQSVDEINKIVPNFSKAYESEKKATENSLESGEEEVTITDYSKYISIAEVDVTKLSGGGIIDSDTNDSTESSSVFLVGTNGENNPEKITLTSKELEDVNVDWFLYKEKLFALTIQYPDYDPPTAQNFAKQVSEKLNLPTIGWKKLLTANIDTPENRKNKVMMTHVEAELNCNGFKVGVRTAYRNPAQITIIDTKTLSEILRLEKEIKERKKKEELERIRLEKEKRGTFKP